MLSMPPCLHDSPDLSSYNSSKIPWTLIWHHSSSFFFPFLFCSFLLGVDWFVARSSFSSRGMVCMRVFGGLCVWDGIVSSGFPFCVCFLALCRFGTLYVCIHVIFLWGACACIRSSCSFCRFEVCCRCVVCVVSVVSWFLYFSVLLFCGFVTGVSLVIEIRLFLATCRA